MIKNLQKSHKIANKNKLNDFVIWTYFQFFLKTLPINRHRPVKSTAIWCTVSLPKKLFTRSSVCQRTIKMQLKLFQLVLRTAAIGCTHFSVTRHHLWPSGARKWIGLLKHMLMKGTVSQLRVQVLPDFFFRKTKHFAKKLFFQTHLEAQIE